MTPHVRTALLTFLLWGCLHESPAQVYRLTDLSLPMVAGINDSGAILLMDGGGNSYIRRDGSTTGIGSPAGFGTTAYAINRESQIVGNAALTSNLSLYHAFRWDDFVFTDLGTLGGSWSVAFNLNNLGHVVGFAAVADTLPWHAFSWVDGTMTDLGTFGSDLGSAAQDINDSGLIVGNADVPLLRIPHAAIFQDGGITDLGTLGGTTSYAVGVNNVGQVIGTSSLDGTSGSMGFIWQDGSMMSLGEIAIPPGWKVGSSQPYGLNDSGEVVGQSTWDANPVTHNYHGFLWRDGVMTDLNAMTDTAGNWEIIRGIGINNGGDIVAIAAYFGSPRAVLLEREDVILTKPVGGEKLIGGEPDTIRWMSGLAPGSNVTLWYTLNDGQTWILIDNGIPAVLQQYVWDVPDTLSTKARVLITSSTDVTQADTSGILRIKGWVLTKFSITGDYVPYTPPADYWGLGNYPEDVWPPTWQSRFNYQGTDPYTGSSYLVGGGSATDAVFQSAVSSQFPDWPAFVEAFRPEQCYRRLSPPVYSPTAVTKWASIKEAWGGSCFGFAISNAWAFRERASFLSAYQNFPDYATPSEVLSDTNVIPVINTLFTHQFGENHATYIQNTSSVKTPNQTIADLKDMLGSDDAGVRSLTIFNNGPGGGGHAVLAYRMKRDLVQPRLYHVYVYDNATPDLTNAEIVVDTTLFGGNGGWSYSSLAGWGGSGQMFLMEPAYLYQFRPDLRKIDRRAHTSVFALPDTIVKIHTGMKEDILIQDSSANVTGYVDSLVRAEIPGSTPLLIQNRRAQPPYGYLMTRRPYSVTLSDFDNPESRVYFFTGTRTFGVARGGATSSQTDRFAFDGNLSIANPDTTAKSYDILNIVAEYVQSREKVYAVNSLALDPNDSVSIANVGADGLKLSSFSPGPSSYRLDVELYDYTGLRQFTHSDISLDGNTSHILQPNWGNITPEMDLTILIDSGNDGIVDDSMIVDNQINAVRGPADGIPAAFALHQNYPNPFNPTTSIAYDLAEAVHVELTVYNVLGERVATLVDEIQGAGSRTTDWDASGLAAGVYFYQLRAGSFTAVQKMMLVK